MIFLVFDSNLSLTVKIVEILYTTIIITHQLNVWLYPLVFHYILWALIVNNIGEINIDTTSITDCLDVLRNIHLFKWFYT